MRSDANISGRRVHLCFMYNVRLVYTLDMLLEYLYAFNKLEIGILQGVAHRQSAVSFMVSNGLNVNIVYRGYSIEIIVIRLNRIHYIISLIKPDRCFISAIENFKVLYRLLCKKDPDPGDCISEYGLSDEWCETMRILLTYG